MQGGLHALGYGVNDWYDRVKYVVVMSAMEASLVGLIRIVVAHASVAQGTSVVAHGRDRRREGFFLKPPQPLIGVFERREIVWRFHVSVHPDLVSGRQAGVVLGGTTPAQYQN
jgi:hypothetical protein